MAFLYRAFQRFRLLNPFTTKKLIGTDLQGNMYFEQPRDNFPRRTVELNDGRSHYTDVCGAPLPVQWIAWLRHTRTYPPTHAELIKADAARQSIIERAQRIDAQEKRKQLAVQAELIKRKSDLEHVTKPQIQITKTTTNPSTTSRRNPSDTFGRNEFEPEPWQPTTTPRR